MSDLRIRMDQEEFETAWAVKVEQPELFGEVDLPSPESQKFAPIAFVMIAVGVALLSKFVGDWWDKLKGGLVIDFRPDRPDNIYRDKDVPANWVIIFPADGGEVKIETKDTPKDAIHQLLEAVIDAALGSVDDVAEAAAKVVDKAKITTNVP